MIKILSQKSLLEILGSDPEGRDRFAKIERLVKVSLLTPSFAHDDLKRRIRDLLAEVVRRDGAQVEQSEIEVLLHSEKIEGVTEAYLALKSPKGITPYYMVGRYLEASVRF